MTPPHINVLVACKGEERYVFTYTDNAIADVLRKFGNFASNPELTFNWYDAAVASKQVRERSRKWEARCDR